MSAETVDWQVVVDHASRITQSASKDLLVGAYLCNALLVREGYTGLAVGLNIINDMIASFWDDMFPPAKRMRARQTAMSWLAEKAGAYVDEHAPAAADAAAVIEAADTLKQIDNALVDKMGEQAPLLNDLAKPLKNYRQSAAAEASKADAAPAAEAAAAPAAQAQPAAAPAAAAAAPAQAAPIPAAAPATGALESEADSKKVLRQLQASIRDVAAFQLAQKLADPRAYRLNRLAAWLVIEIAPPGENGVTQVNPPPAERLKFFELQQEKGDHAALIPELEKTLARSPFWVDGHFAVVKSLRALGAEYDSAAQAVVRELHGFLERLPEVLELSFADGSAFAGDQARMWIDAEVLAQAGEGGGAASGLVSEGEPWNLALAEARQLAAAGDSDKALALVNDGLAAAGCIRDQIYWRCALAELLLQTGKAEAASAILESLSQQAQSRQMAEWEPRLLARIYNQLFQSYQKQQKVKKDDKSLKAKSEQAFEQLCWFDPVTALTLKGG